MSNTTDTPGLTPNVVVANPGVRKVMNIVLGVALVALPAASILDLNSTAFDWSAFLIPATAVTSFLAGIFGLAVTTPNVPSKVLPPAAAEVAEDAAVDYPAEEDPKDPYAGL